MKTFISEMKSVANEFSAREWMAVLAGVVIFVIISGVC